MLRCRDQVRYGASIARRLQLFVYDLDLFVENLSRKPIDRDVDPVVLLTLDNEIVLETCCVWFIAT